MPLSEHEEHILRQIEAQLQRDPGFARDLTPQHVASKRSLVSLVAGTVLAIAVSVLLLGISPYLAFAAFVVAMVVLARAERHLRAVSDEALRQLASMRRQAPTGRGE